VFKKSVIAVGVVMVVTLLVFGWEKSWSYVQGTRSVLNQEADAGTPIKLESARIAALVQKESDAILAREDKICDLETRRRSMAQTVEEGKKGIRSEMAVLRQVKILLDEKKPEYQIGRATFTYAEVNSDALDRVATVRRMQEGIAADEVLLADLDGAIKQGYSSLNDARKRIVELKNGMARLEARNANAEVRLELAKLTNVVAGDQLTADSELKKAVQNFENRVAQKERQAVVRLNGANRQFRIDYSAAMVTQEATTEIERVLTNDATSKPTPPAPAAPRSASEALKINAG
jgi:hypothetical protein